MTKFYSIKNLQVNPIRLQIYDQFVYRLVVIPPGISLGHSEAEVEAMKKTQVFQQLLTNGALHLIREEKVKVKDDGGIKVTEDKDYLLPVTDKETVEKIESGKRTKYNPTRYQLTQIKGIGTKTADKILEITPDGGWHSFSEMVNTVQNQLGIEIETIQTEPTSVTY